MADLPDDIDDITAPGYNAPVVHGRCTDPDCGLEAGITDFEHDEPTWCPGTDEFNEDRDENGHLTIWEVIDDADV